MKNTRSVLKLVAGSKDLEALAAALDELDEAEEDRKVLRAYGRALKRAKGQKFPSLEDAREAGKVLRARALMHAESPEES